jgi:ketosteroid isomerase-like protein
MDSWRSGHDVPAAFPAKNNDGVAKEAFMKFSVHPLAVALASCFFFLAVASGSAPAADEKAMIEEVIRANIGWAKTKDRPLLESTLARDQQLLIINPDSEITVGWEQFVKNFAFWMDPRFKATRTDIRDLRIAVSPSGITAWWSCILDDLGEWDGRPIGWKDTRWTGVLEKREGKWLIVQMHFSFAADKVAAEVKAKLAKDASPLPADKE